MPPASTSKSPGGKRDYDYLFKLVLIGDSGVGKSCLLLRFAVSYLFCRYRAYEHGRKKNDERETDTTVVKSGGVIVSRQGDALEWAELSGQTIAKKLGGVELRAATVRMARCYVLCHFSFPT